MDYISSDEKRFCIFVPNSILETRYTGKIFGYYYSDTEVFNITGTASSAGGIEIGVISPKTGYVSTNLVGYWEGTKLKFIYKEKVYQIVSYELEKNVFSRNQGIIEPSWMQNKKVVIIGCGSVGSFISLELARSGVDHFVLVDNDIVEYDNICRHQCGVSDVGKYKINAVKTRILDINPQARVDLLNSVFEKVPNETLSKIMDYDTMVISCADNRETDAYANEIAVIHSVPFVSVGFWERASVGEIFYYLPNKKMTCYKSAFKNLLIPKDNSGRRFYTMEYTAPKIYMSPGIAVDIDFVTIIACKVILDILNRNVGEYVVKVLSQFSQYTLICNSNDSRIGGDIVEIFSYPLQITRNLQIDTNNEVCRRCDLIQQCCENSHN